MACCLRKPTVNDDYNGSIPPESPLKRYPAVSRRETFEDTIYSRISKLSGGAVTLPTGNKEDIKNVHVQRERSIAYLSGKDLVSIDELEVDRQEQRVHKPKPVSKAPSRITRKDSRIAYRIAAQHEKEKADTAHKAQLGIVDEHSVLNDRQKLNKRLSQLGLTMISMADDGNCQFRSLSYELYDTQEHHKLVRRKCVEYIKRNRKRFVMYFDGNGELDHYIRTMGQNRTWGDELTLRACCDAYGLAIHVIQSTRENWHLLYEPEKKQSKKKIFVVYLAPVHYNALKPA
mmetsp:Transcript_12292/g.44822  ORF Transcript_12292/g.44822 Transcript_12292/m.44822 type:complete len:288 (-) Transcript_12292:2121-2984(-)